MGLEKRYGYCICHFKMSSLNAKGLCPIGAKERHERSAISKGLTVKKKEDGIDSTRGSKTTFIATELHSKYSTESNEKSKINTKKTKIKSISKIKNIELSILVEIKKRKILLQGNACEMCGTISECLDLFHIIVVGDKKHSTNSINLLLSCRLCHLIWGANDWSKIVKFKNFNEIMERLKSLDEGKYWKLKHKIENYYATTSNI